MGHPPRAGLFQNRKEAVAAARRAQKGQSPVTRTGDKVQMMSPIRAMQAAGHDNAHRTGSIVPALANNARTGHPQFRNGKERHGRMGHPPHRTGSIVPALAKNARTGHPQFRNGKERHGRMGHPPQDTSGCKTYNWASTAGAVVGGAVTGVGAAVTPLYQASLELAELPATVLTSTVSGLGGTASGALVTQTLSSQQQQSSPKCGCH